METATWKIESIPAFCITLERRKDRWKRFQDQPGIRNMNIKRFIGVDGKTLDIKNDKRVGTLTKRTILRNSRRSHEELDSAGGVGCALSHIAVWQWMVDNQQEMCLVFEDDAVVYPDIYNTVKKVIETKDPEEWDIMLLGYFCQQCSIYNADYYETTDFWGLHGYIISKSGMKKLKDLLPINDQIDLEMGRLARENKLSVYCVKNQKVVPGEFGTDLQMPVSKI